MGRQRVPTDHNWHRAQLLGYSFQSSLQLCPAPFWLGGVIRETLSFTTPGLTSAVFAEQTFRRRAMKSSKNGLHRFIFGGWRPAPADRQQTHMGTATTVGQAVHPNSAS